jgi:hypothetical protein
MSLPDFARTFPRYTDFDPIVPTYCVTPDLTGVIHRFFDTSPISPSGRYLALTQFPFEDRLPKPGDVATVLLVNLQTGENKVIAETRGWDTQLGAQVQWGSNDANLYFNDLDPDTWTPHSVKFDPISGQSKKLDGTVYMVSPDGKQLASPCLLRTGLAQSGYGVIIPPEKIPLNHGASFDDGIYITSTETGKKTLLVSNAEIFESAVPSFSKEKYAEGDFYGFHIKWNPQGTRLMYVFRWCPHDKTKPLLNNVITLSSDGTDIRVAVPDSIWCKGGHHPNWHPNGEEITMNLKPTGERLELISVRYDGSNLRVLSETIPGSGHPTLHPNERHILTDVYAHESLAYPDGTTPMRWIDLEKQTEQPLLRIRSLPDFNGPKKELRVDPHPAWDNTFTRIAFNACPSGKRQVFISDLRSLL